MLTRVASIYFAPVTAARNYRGAAYKIPAVPLSAEPAVVECRDLVQRDWGPMLPGTSKRQEYRWLVAGEEIARDIVGQWTGSTTISIGMDPACHPGIWVVRDRLPVVESHGKLVNNEMTYEERMVLDAESHQVFRDATDEERKAMWDEDLASARDADRRYAEWCWNEGNSIIARRDRGEMVLKEVPALYKLAARQYGLEAAWLKEAASHESRMCPHCGKPGSKNTFICGNCQQPTDLEAWAAWQARKDAALRAATAHFESPAKAGKIAPPLAGITSRDHANV